MTQLESALGSIDAAQGCIAAGDPEQAAQHLIQAAEDYYSAGLAGEGAQRIERMEKAVQMARMARQLRQTPQPDTSREPKRSRGSDEGEGLTQFAPEPRPDTRFSDVVGLQEAKRAVDLALIRPLKHPELAHEFGIKPGGGILLYGPPGTGKTLLGRAVAGEVDAPFFYIKPADIMSQWVGQAERNIRGLFEQAGRYQTAVIFIDEVESLAPSRKGNRSTVMARVVPQILAEMEGFDGKRRGLMFIGATNCPEKLDEAMLRPGRFDRKIHVGPPDADGRREMFGLHLQGRKLAQDIDYEALADATEGLTGADIAGICEEAARRAFEEASTQPAQERCIGMQDLLHELIPTGLGSPPFVAGSARARRGTTAPPDPHSARR